MKTMTLSVLKLNTFIKNILDAEVFLSNISLVGEVTNFKVSGGNAYFDLKDENASVACVKFLSNDLDIKNGDLITVFGKVNFYVKSGSKEQSLCREFASAIARGRGAYVAFA